MRNFFCVNCKDIGLEQPCFLGCHDAVTPSMCVLGYDQNWVEYKDFDDFETKHYNELGRVTE